MKVDTVYSCVGLDKDTGEESSYIETGECYINAFEVIAAYPDTRRVVFSNGKDVKLSQVSFEDVVDFMETREMAVRCGG